jgi:HEAT repeat protein
MQSERRALPANEQEQFRASAVKVLKDSAFNDEPVIRMHAIEAFQDVAPREGIPCIEANIENGYSGVSFASLMALGTIRNSEFIERIRIRAEDADTNVVIAALFALHRLGDQGRTGELSEYLLNHRDARVRANAAMAIGRLGEPKSVKLLQIALQQETKIAPKLQILEALANYENRHAIERLMAYAYDPRPDVSALALNFLANAGCEKAEELFLYRLHSADYPEIKLQAARGLGRLGRDDGLDLALAYLRFNSPERNRANDPPEQQIARIRSLAALALEAIGSTQSLGPLKEAFSAAGQSADVRIAVARAAIRIIDQHGGGARISPAKRGDAETKEEGRVMKDERRTAP